MQQQEKTRIVWVDRIAAIAAAIIFFIIAYLFINAGFKDFSVLPSEYQAIAYWGTIKFVVASLLIATVVTWFRNKW